MDRERDGATLGTEARGWAYSAFAARQARLFPDLIDAPAFASRLARMQRTILEVIPEHWITYDGTRAPLT